MSILELCSEDAYNSWTFWSSQNKTETECMEIVRAIEDLVRERKLVALEQQSDGSFVNVILDINRLEKEVRQSMTADRSLDKVYWFSATDEGKKEDCVRRNKKQH